MREEDFIISDVSVRELLHVKLVL